MRIESEEQYNKVKKELEKMMTAFIQWINKHYETWVRNSDIDKETDFFNFNEGFFKNEKIRKWIEELSPTQFCALYLSKKIGKMGSYSVFFELVNLIQKNEWDFTASWESEKFHDMISSVSSFLSKYENPKFTVEKVTAWLQYFHFYEECKALNYAAEMRKKHNEIEKDPRSSALILEHFGRKFVKNTDYMKNTKNSDYALPTLAELQNELVDMVLAYLNRHAYFPFGVPYTIVHVLAHKKPEELVCAYVVDKIEKHIGHRKDSALTSVSANDQNFLKVAMIGKKSKSDLVMRICETLKTLKGIYKFSEREIYKWLSGIWHVIYIHDHYFPQLYQNSHPSMDRLAKVKLMVLGDSVSAGYGIKEKKERWVECLKNKFFDSCEVVNCSIVGLTTKEGIQIIEPLLEAMDPDIVLCTLGGNDVMLGTPVDSITENMKNIKASFSRLGRGSIFLWAIPPDDFIQTRKGAYENIEGEYLEEFNQKVNAHTDLGIILKSEEGVFDESKTSDGLHPKAEGHKKIFEMAHKKLEKYIHQEAMRKKNASPRSFLFQYPHQSQKEEHEEKSFKSLDGLNREF